MVQGGAALGPGRGRATSWSAERSAETYGLPVVMTVEETATFLRLNAKTVYASIEGGDLPGKKVGPRRVVVLRDALLEWLKARGLPSSRRR